MASLRSDLNRSPRNRRVLLVEDDPVSGTALTAILRRRGFEVTHVTTVAQGLAQLSNEPNFLLLDLMLPDGNGSTLLKIVRERELHTRVVVTTAVHDAGVLRMVASLNPEIVMQKPIDITRLLALMEPVH